jgi:hypothetical protein
LLLQIRSWPLRRQNLTKLKENSTRCKGTFDAAMAEKQRLQDETDLTKRRMDAATALISGLSGEKHDGLSNQMIFRIRSPDWLETVGWLVHLCHIAVHSTKRFVIC